MIYSRFYKKHYPFLSDTEIYDLNSKETQTLLEWVEGFHLFILESIMDARKYGFVYELMPGSEGLAAVERASKEISDNIKNKTLNEEDINTINLIVQCHKYNRIIYTFFQPTVESI